MRVFTATFAALDSIVEHLVLSSTFGRMFVQNGCLEITGYSYKTLRQSMIRVS